VRTQIVQAIRAEILEGRLAPGQRLIERELCARLEVGRNSLREAYRQLEAEGFITIVPHKGPTVTAMSDAEARSVYEVREALECYAVRRFVERATPATVEQLVEAVSRLRCAHESGDVDQMLSVKQDFYQVLYQGADNPVLRDQAALLSSRLFRLRSRSLSVSSRPAHSIAEIDAVLSRILAGDAAGASDLWREHIHHAAVAALTR
jgi:DNA-binding GntR family transcriptional regulator